MRAQTRPRRRSSFSRPARASASSRRSSARDFTELGQRLPQLETDLEAHLQGGFGLRERLQDAESLIKTGPGIEECRPRGRLETGLPEVGHGLLVQFAPHGVMSQAFDLLREPLRVQRLDRLHDASVQSSPPVLQDAPVGHLVRERMLEGVFEVREDARLVQELGGLKMTQSPTKVVLGRIGDYLQQREGHILPNDRGGLEKTLVLGRQAIDAGGEDGLRRRRDLPRLRGLGYPVRPTRPDEHLRLDERPHTFFQEERVPLGATNQGPPERLEGRILAEQGRQQLLGTLGRQGIDAQLEVVGLAPPPMLVLGSVVGEEQDTGGGQTVHETVEQRLGLGVDPVEVLDDQQQGLDLALPEQQALDRLEGLPSALRRIEGLPVLVVDGDIEQCQERRQKGFQRAVERQQLARHSLANGPRVITLLDAAIGLEQLDDGQVRRRFAIRDRPTLEHEPSVRTM